LKITGKVVAMEAGPELEPAVNGFILRFAYHSPRMLRADCQFLLEQIKQGTSFLMITTTCLNPLVRGGFCWYNCACP